MKQLLASLKRINIDYIFYSLLLVFFIFLLLFSNFRDAIRDETIYIHETYLISELLKNGVWIGDYAVGLHGFLFKLPPAIIFMLIPPSVFVLTLYNIILTIVVCYFFYKFLKEAFLWKGTALLVTILLMSNLRFILSTTRYLREIPSLVVVVMLLYAISRKWKPWAIGIVFLLLLDVKEYLFLMFGFGYFIWLVLKHFKVYTSKNFIERLKNLFVESIQVFGFSIIWMILMFTTSAIPINMFIASLFALVDSGTTYLASNFAIDTATANLLDGDNVKTISGISTNENLHPFIQFLINVYNVIVVYIGKMLYPRTFSFLSIPKVIILPALYMGFILFKEAWSKNQNKLNDINLIFPVLMFSYIFVYLLRASHGRYLLPIIPLVAIYFVYFLYYKYHNLKSLKKILFVTFCFLVGGFLFEVSYVPFKIILETFLFICIVISVVEPFKISKDFYLLFRKFTLFSCVFFMFCVTVLFAQTLGQIKHSQLFGPNREIDKIVEIIPEESKFWINNSESYGLMAMYVGQTYEWPEWNWDLSPYVPKKRLLKTYGEKYIYNDWWSSNYNFRNYLLENDIEYVILMESQVFGEEFRLQEKVWDARKVDWLELEKVEQLKNQRIYLFKVNL